MKGGAYPKGGQFDISKRQTKAGMLFDMKYYHVNITEFVEDIEVTLRTPAAVFNTVKVDLANAALTMSAILEIAIIRHGQAIAGDDRSIQINGFEEALNDGVTASYKGNLFPSYGGQARVDVSPALTPPQGLITPSVPGGTLTNRTLEQSYQSCVIGEEHPKLGVTTPRGTGFMNENYLPLQRLQDTVEPTIGWPGLKFKQATIVESNYMPGADGVNDPDLGDYSSSNGETFLWLNPGPEGDEAYFRLHISASPKYQFGFTGFKVSRDDTQVAGQILAALNFIVRAPRLMRFLYGITT